MTNIDTKYKIIFVRCNNNLNSASFNRYLSIILATIHYCEVIGISNRTVRKGNTAERDLFKRLDIEYVFPMVNNKKKNSFLCKAYDVLISNYKTLCVLSSIVSKKNNNKNVVFLYSTSIIDFIFFYIGKLIFKYKLITERNEYPTHIRNRVAFFKKLWFYVGTWWICSYSSFFPYLPTC